MGEDYIQPQREERNSSSILPSESLLEQHTPA